MRHNYRQRTSSFVEYPVAKASISARSSTSTVVTAQRNQPTRILGAFPLVSCRRRCGSLYASKREQLTAAPLLQPLHNKFRETPFLVQHSIFGERGQTFWRPKKQENNIIWVVSFTRLVSWTNQYVRMEGKYESAKDVNNQKRDYLPFST